MTIRLAPDVVVLSDCHNHYNLELHEWQAINAGQAIDIETVPPQLEGLVEEVPQPEMEG